MTRFHFHHHSHRRGEVGLGWELGGRYRLSEGQWLKIPLASRRCACRPSGIEPALGEDIDSDHSEAPQLPHQVGSRGGVVLVLEEG